MAAGPHIPLHQFSKHGCIALDSIESALKFALIVAFLSIIFVAQHENACFKRS